MHNSKPQISSVTSWQSPQIHAVCSADVGVSPPLTALKMTPPIPLEPFSSPFKREEKRAKWSVRQTTLEPTEHHPKVFFFPRGAMKIFGAVLPMVLLTAYFICQVYGIPGKCTWFSSLPSLLIPALILFSLNIRRASNFMESFYLRWLRQELKRDYASQIAVVELKGLLKCQGRGWGKNERELWCYKHDDQKDSGALNRNKEIRIRKFRKGGKRWV